MSASAMRYILIVYSVSPRGRAAHWVPFRWRLVGDDWTIYSVRTYEHERSAVRAARRYAKRHGIEAVDAEYGW